MMNRGQHVGSVSVAKYMLASYAVFGMVGAALFGIGVGLAGELSAGWLELKRASPMPPLAYLLAKCCSAPWPSAPIIVSLLTLARHHRRARLASHFAEYAPHDRPDPRRARSRSPAWAWCIALLVPFNSAPGITNMIYLPMSFCGGLWVPIMILPHCPAEASPCFCPRIISSQLVLGVFGYADSREPLQPLGRPARLHAGHAGRCLDRLPPPRTKLLILRRTLFRKPMTTNEPISTRS